MKTGIRVTDTAARYDEKSVVLFHTESPDGVATLALQFLERWSMVAAMPDGEDSAGRAKLRLPTADEVVQRAFDIAERAIEVTRSRGHMLTLPDLNEVNQALDEKRAAKAAAKDAAQAA